MNLILLIHTTWP